MVGVHWTVSTSTFQVARRLWPESSSLVTFSEFLKAFTDVCVPNPVLLAKNKLHVKYLSALLCESSFDDTVSKQRCMPSYAFRFVPNSL